MKNEKKYNFTLWKQLPKEVNKNFDINIHMDGVRKILEEMKLAISSVG